MALKDLLNTFKVGNALISTGSSGKALAPILPDPAPAEIPQKPPVEWSCLLSSQAEGFHQWQAPVNERVYKTQANENI